MRIFIAFGLPKYWHQLLIWSNFLLSVWLISCLYNLTGLTWLYFIKYMAITHRICSHSWTFWLTYLENHMVDSIQFCRWLHSLKVPELVCALWLSVINPSRLTVNLAFSGGSGHGLPQLLLLLLLELSNSGVYPDTDRDRVGRNETDNPKLSSCFVPYPVLWRTHSLSVAPAMDFE